MDDLLKLLESKLEILDEFSITDLDEIALNWGVYSRNSPPLIRDIYDEFRGNIEIGAPLQDSFDLDRLIRALKIQKKLDPNSKDESDDELVPTFKLKSNDKKRVVLLCAQMRKIVFASEVFDQPHRKRLLNRIAAIEKQIEQPKGMLDVILGGVSDIGETLGKFGGDIKPLTNRMAEVMQITRAGSKEYEQLPAPEERKQLPKPSDEETAKG